MLRQRQETEILKRLQAGLVYKNIFIRTKNWKLEACDPKRVIGSSALKLGIFFPGVNGMNGMNGTTSMPKGTGESRVKFG